jgi:sigma-B regulation protein RsbU (phosphoserine phosphatase)
MRDKIYTIVILAFAGLLLILGRGLLRESTVFNFGLTFAGTTAAGILGIALYRVQLELRASRQELAMKQAELNFALEVQLSLFPREFPPESGMEFSGVCIPARGVSGDYYDVIPLSGGRIGIAIADISGKGMSAAILMSNLQAVLRTLAAADARPDTIAARLNLHLHQVTQGSRFATLFYAEWDGATRRLAYINAGHNAPIVVGASGVKRLNAVNTPLGIFPESVFKIEEASLDPGSLMVLFSDGVTDAGMTKGREFGDEQLAELVKSRAHMPLAEIQKNILGTVEQWTEHDFEDDFTLLLARTSALGKEDA